MISHPASPVFAPSQTFTLHPTQHNTNSKHQINNENAYKNSHPLPPASLCTQLKLHPTPHAPKPPPIPHITEPRTFQTSNNLAFATRLLVEITHTAEIRAKRAYLDAWVALGPCHAHVVGGDVLAAAGEVGFAAHVEGTGGAGAGGAGVCCGNDGEGEGACGEGGGGAETRKREEEEGDGDALKRHRGVYKFCVIGFDVIGEIF